MEQFSLDKYLENPTRKVVTRDGRPVRILCTDAKAKDGCCIIAAIETDGEEEGYQFFKNGKAYSSKSSIEDCADLFFADEKERLTEFERELEMMMVSFSNGNLGSDIIKEMSKQKLHDYAHRLLDLARKEILKDLPKWKKATEHKDLEKHIAILEDGKVLLSNYLEEGDYYIELDNLKTLPKEE